MTLNAAILADVAPDMGYTRSFEYCIRVPNLDAYPDHVFFAQLAQRSPDNRTTPPLLIQTNECIPLEGYRPIAWVVALPKAELKPQDLTAIPKGELLFLQQNGQGWIVIQRDEQAEANPNPKAMWKADKAQQAILNPNLEARFIRSESTFTPPSQLPFFYQDKRIEDSFKIQSVDGQRVAMTFVGRSPQFWNWLVFPLLGLALLVGVFLWRKRQTPKQP
jgi:hypothetical protein